MPQYTKAERLSKVAEILKCKNGTPRDYGDGTGRQSARVEQMTVENLKMMKSVQGTLIVNKVTPATPVKTKIMTVKLRPSQIAFKSTEMKVVEKKKSTISQ